MSSSRTLVNDVAVTAASKHQRVPPRDPSPDIRADKKQIMLGKKPLFQVRLKKGPGPKNQDMSGERAGGDGRLG